MGTSEKKRTSRRSNLLRTQDASRRISQRRKMCNPWFGTRILQKSDKRHGSPKIGRRKSRKQRNRSQAQPCRVWKVKVLHWLSNTGTAKVTLTTGLFSNLLSAASERCATHGQSTAVEQSSPGKEVLLQSQLLARIIQSKVSKFTLPNRYVTLRIQHIASKPRFWPDADEFFAAAQEHGRVGNDHLLLQDIDDKNEQKKEKKSQVRSHSANYQGTRRFGDGWCATAPAGTSWHPSRTAGWHANVDPNNHGKDFQSRHHRWQHDLGSRDMPQRKKKKALKSCTAKTQKDVSLLIKEERQLIHDLIGKQPDLSSHLGLHAVNAADDDEDEDDTDDDYEEVAEMQDVHSSILIPLSYQILCKFPKSNLFSICPFSTHRASFFTFSVNTLRLDIFPHLDYFYADIDSNAMLTDDEGKERQYYLMQSTEYTHYGFTDEQLNASRE